MADESTPEGLLMIRASRGDHGEIVARITEGDDEKLEIHTTSDEAEIITIVKNWLNRLRT